MAKRGLLIVMLTALAAAGSAGAARQVAPIRGVVVSSQHGTLLVASPRGAVSAVRGRAAVGSRVLVRGTQLTLLGRAHRAVLRGVVVRHTGSLTFLSAASHMLVVHGGRRLSSARDTGPAAGTVVQETVGIDDQGDLQGETEHQLGQAGQAQVQATIASIGTGTVTLTVNGQSLTIPLPAGLTLPANLVGTQVTLNLSFANGQVTASDDDQGDGEQGDDDGGNAGSGSFQLGGTIGSGGNHHGDGGGGGSDG